MASKYLITRWPQCARLHVLRMDLRRRPARRRLRFWDVSMRRLPLRLALGIDLLEIALTPTALVGESC